MATRTRSLSPPPSINHRSPFSLTKANEHTDELLHSQQHLEGNTESGGPRTSNERDLTTSGRTYQELVEQFENDASEEMTEESDSLDMADGRKSVGCFLTGRNSLSHWGDETMDSSVPIPTVGGKDGETRVSSLETPLVVARMDSSNVSQRNNSRVNSRSDGRGTARTATSYSKQFGSVPRRSTLSNNLSHISSSSSSNGDALGESWSPIQHSLENSFTRNEEKSSEKKMSKSPLQDRANSRSKSPVPLARKSRSKSPIRSPLADLSPNRSRAKSPLKSDDKKLLSPNGTYSLKEAEATVTEQVNEASTKQTVAQSKSIPTLGKSNASTLFSPEKPIARTHARSPAPTPNSQRRVIKRLRASLPTAKYLDQDEVMEIDEVQALENVAEHSSNGTDAECNSPAVAQTTNACSTLPATTYKNVFEFPAISGPLNATLDLFHQDAIAGGPSSQQYQLTVAGTDLLSMQEVILPSIAYDTNAVLKKLQAKAQRNVKDGTPDSEGKDVVDVIETCRRVVSSCTSYAISEAGKSWRERQETRKRAHLERHLDEMEKQKQVRAQAKIQRKEERALAKQQRYERLKYEKQKSHPRNKEMWQEVAKLMMEIQKLEKEERLWKEALAEVDLMEKNFKPPEKVDLESLDDSNSPRAQEQEKLCNAVKCTDLETKSITMLQDATIATERIAWMLQSVSLAMEESDRLRQEAYQKYEYEGHKFYGYQTGDSKGLFVALSMDDSFAG